MLDRGEHPVQALILFIALPSLRIDGAQAVQNRRISLDPGWEPEERFRRSPNPLRRLLPCHSWAALPNRRVIMASKALRGHLKTGHRGSPKIRPMGGREWRVRSGCPTGAQSTPYSFPIALVDVGVTGRGHRCPVVAGRSWIEPRHPQFRWPDFW